MLKNVSNVGNMSKWVCCAEWEMLIVGGFRETIDLYL